MLVDVGSISVLVKSLTSDSLDGVEVVGIGLASLAYKYIVIGS